MKKCFLLFFAFSLLCSCSGKKNGEISREITRDSLSGMWLHYDYKEYEGDESGKVTDQSGGIGVVYDLHRYGRESILIRSFNAEEPDTLSSVVLRNYYTSLYSSWSFNTTLNERWRISKDSLFVERYKGNFNANFYEGKIPAWFKMRQDDTLVVKKFKYAIEKISKDTLILANGNYKLLFKKCKDNSSIEKFVKDERNKRR